MKQMTQVAVGLGGNKGDRGAFLRAALERISEDLLIGAKASPFYETPAWGGIAKAPFLNAVVVGETDWKPPAILNYLKELERELGRTPGPRYADREIDLDVLAYGEAVWHSDGLCVPHPELAKRAFVLLPMNDVWPDWKDPHSGKTLAQLLADCPPDPSLRRLPT